ncbi:MAG: PIN domain-containing protein [Longimicrobiales bacterium]
MRILIDINVLLDVVLHREPWVYEAAPLLTAAEEGRVDGYISSHTVTTIYYLVSKTRDRLAAGTAVTDLLRIARVVPVGEPDFQQALVLDLADFEDAVQVAAALNVGADYLVTRNEADFRDAPVAIRTPAEVLALL